jgi:hypothetical protein
MLPSYRHVVHIDRPVPEVFAYVTDPVNLPRWQRSIIAVVPLPGPAAGLGSRVQEVRLVLGRRVASTWRVTGYEPTSAAAVTVEDGPLRGEARYRLDEDGDGTRLVFEVDLDAVTLPMTVRRVGLHAAQALLAADADRLRRQLERSGAPAPPAIAGA